jgi:hypothetical protein
LIFNDEKIDVFLPLKRNFSAKCFHNAAPGGNLAMTAPDTMPQCLYDIFRAQSSSDAEFVQNDCGSQAPSFLQTSSNMNQASCITFLKKESSGTDNWGTDDFFFQISAAGDDM